MAPFRALTKVVFTLSIFGAGALAGQVSKPGKAPVHHTVRSNLFSGLSERDLSANRVSCGFGDTGNSCFGVDETGVSEGGIWPTNSLDSYLYNSGPDVVGVIAPTAGFPWSGDTVGAFFLDFRGDQAAGTPLTGMLSSRDTADLKTWPSAALLRDTSLFNSSILGRPSASDQDLWTRYWEGDPHRLSGRTHPMGIVIDQRVMAFNAPTGNPDIIYLVYTMTNVTASDPAVYNQIDPAVRRDYAALGAQFKHLNDSAFGINLPTSGFTIDSMFFSQGVDADVGTQYVASNYSNLSLPMETAFAYEAPFSEASWSFPSSLFGAPGLAPAPGLVGVKYLRYPVDQAGKPLGIRIFTNHTGSGTGYPDPVGILQLYRYLSGTSNTLSDGPCSFQGQQIQLKYCFLLQVSADTRFDFSSGPFTLAPGQQQTVALAYLFAAPRDTVLPYVGGDLKPGFPSPGDAIAADSTRVRLIERVAGWVTQHDDNGDGIIEANEVKTWPGSLFNKAQIAQAFFNAKFAEPEAPTAPSFFLVPGDHRVTVVWQKSASEGSGNPYFSIASDPTTALYDPNFRQFDVEGYRIYRGLSPNALQLVAQVDYAGTVMEDYIGDFDYQAACAPEFGLSTGCPALFTSKPSPSIHVPHALIGNVVQIPFGGRTVARNGAVSIVAADTAVTGGASGFPSLSDAGVSFSYVDFSPTVQNSFQYYYAVTAFTVNSVRSGPSSLESPRLVKTVTPRTGATFPAGTIGTPVLLSAAGVVLNSAAPTLSAATGEFSGPAAPTQGLSTAILSFIPEVIDTGSLTLRVDSVSPGMNTIDDGFQAPTTYFLSSTNSRGRTDRTKVQILVDGTLGSTQGNSAPFAGASVLPSKAVTFGADTSFALVAQATVSTSGTWDLTGPGRASIDVSPANSALTGSRWWGGAANENTQGPTDSLCNPASSTCALTASQLTRTGGALPGVTFIAPIQAYSTVPSIPMRDLETMTATVYRAADFNIYWGTSGNVDSVVDVTHGVPVPFDPRVGPTWGILDSTSFAGVPAADTPDTNNSVLTWSDIFCVAPVPAMFGARLLLGCPNQTAPLVHAAHLSTMGRATGPYRVIPASQGPGFIFYLAGKFWLVSAASLPTAGTVWHARYVDGHIVGARPNLTYTPAPISSPAVPGLRLRMAFAGSSVDLTHTNDSMLARIHTVPDPFYVTNALSTATDSQHIEFVHLPPEAIIRIYSVSGRLVALLTHNDPTGGGQQDWNVKSRDGKVVASGVYFYVVETADRRSKVGRFTVVTYRP